MSLTISDGIIKHPDYKNKRPEQNVIARVTNKNGKDRLYFGKNIVTAAGILFYAKRIGNAAVDAPNFFDDTRRIALQNPPEGTSLGIAPENTYEQFMNPITNGSTTPDLPIVNNLDADNTESGASVVTWRGDWTASSFGQGNADDLIRGGCIHTAGDPPVDGTAALLAHWEFTVAFRKTTSDTLTVWINHGVGAI